MNTCVASRVAFAAVLFISAVSANAASALSSPNHDAVLAVQTSLDASPSDVLSPAIADAPANTSQFPGLFEQESPTLLIATALVVGLVTVGNALYDRRRRMARSRDGGDGQGLNQLFRIAASRRAVLDRRQDGIDHRDKLDLRRRTRLHHGMEDPIDQIGM